MRDLDIKKRKKKGVKTSNLSHKKIKVDFVDSPYKNNLQKLFDIRGLNIRLIKLPEVEQTVAN